MTLLRMAAGYRHSAELLRQRIKELREQAKGANPAEKAQLDRRIRELNTLLRETREVALVLERYYDRRHCKNERYTF